MGVRFHRSVRLLPGVRINFSKSGASLSLGGKGLTYNIGSKRNRATVGIPGSGLSYSKTMGNGKARTLTTAIIVIAVLAYVAKLIWEHYGTALQ